MEHYAWLGFLAVAIVLYIPGWKFRLGTAFALLAWVIVDQVFSAHTGNPQLDTIENNGQDGLIGVGLVLLILIGGGLWYRFQNKRRAVTDPKPAQNRSYPSDRAPHRG
jgi:hypothetical protein